jgi:flavin-dependent dehydrogenase
MSTADDAWDATVIGAGPAGSLTALLLARRGLRVALIEKCSLPRAKSCGGCLGPRGAALLRELGLGDVVAGARFAPWNGVEFASPARRVAVALPGGAVIDRSLFDQGLSELAVEAGVELFARSTATVAAESSPAMRSVRVQSAEGPVRTLESRVVIVADGLGRTSLRELPQFACHAVAGSKIGLAIPPHEASRLRSTGYPLGLLTMAVAKDGYLGVARLGDGEFRIAAAIDARLAQGGDLGGWISESLASCGLPAIEGIQNVQAKGTLALTRRPACSAAKRLFVLGDSAGYVEPITGEGMTRAFDAARALAPLAASAANQWRDQHATQWQLLLRTHLARRSFVSRWLARLLQSPVSAGLVFRAASVMPRATSRIAQYVHRPGKTLQEAA